MGHGHGAWSVLGMMGMGMETDFIHVCRVEYFHPDPVSGGEVSLATRVLDSVKCPVPGNIVQGKEEMEMILQCCAGEFSKVQCNAVQWSVVQYGAMRYSAVECSAVQCSAVQCSAV